ncbi:hypothetical protein C8Q70DRAFT_913815 [Cubamyces menziesii]|nr:hypothetical protein C8Q70DRAFT_913815 [Cubamyces menziesii]
MSTSQRASRSPGGPPSCSQGDPAPYKHPGPALVNLPTSGIPRQSASPSSSSMIGQIPSLFDPSMAIPPDSGLDYQQWVENYANGQYAYPQQAPMPGNVSQVPYQQQQPPPQSQLHHVQTSPTAAVPAPAQNRYNFVQEFAPGEQAASTYDTHTFVRPAADRPQRGMPRISRQGGASANVGYPVAPNLRIPEPPRGAYQQPQVSPHHQQQAAFAVPGTAQGADSYFYGPTSVTADVISGSADQQQQQQQQRHHSNYHFVQQQYPAEPYSANTYTPSSDFTNLPSSVSTPSVGGTEDSQHAFSSASSHLSQQTAPQQQPQASSSRQTAGSAGRGRGRGGIGGGRQQKRQRHNDPDDDGDSETQSDDDQPPTMAGLNMTVSVPPPQGQNSLPARL